MTRQFKAPWSVLVWIISGWLTAMWVWTLVLLATGFTPPIMMLCGLFSLIVVPSALFTIRGYTVTEDALLIRRLFWSTRLPLTGLQSVAVLPRAMRRSIRTFGNPGVFSISGTFWSQTLGTYRAYATNSKRTVVLKMAGRMMIVSPDSPEEFARALSPHIRNA
jgi:hypothetical protein